MPKINTFKKAQQVNKSITKSLREKGLDFDDITPELGEKKLRQQLEDLIDFLERKDIRLLKFDSKGKPVQYSPKVMADALYKFNEGVNAETGFLPQAARPSEAKRRKEAKKTVANAPAKKTTKKAAKKNPVKNLVEATEKPKGASGSQGMLGFKSDLPDKPDTPKETPKPQKPKSSSKGVSGSQMTFGFADDSAKGAAKGAAKTAASTAGKTAASTAAKRGALSTLLRGGGALAGGGVGMTLLALSMLPMLLGSAKMSANRRETAREEGRLAAETRRRQLMNTLSPSAPQGIADSLYRDQLRSAYRQETKPGKSISPELASLLGESQGKLQEISRQGGGMTVGQILERFDR